MTVFRAATLRTFFFRYSRGSKRVNKSSGYGNDRLFSWVACMLLMLVRIWADISFNLIVRFSKTFDLIVQGVQNIFYSSFNLKCLNEIEITQKVIPRC